MSRKSYRARLVVAKNRSGAPTAARRLVRLDKQKIRVGVARSGSETGLHSNFSLLFSLDCIKYSSNYLLIAILTFRSFVLTLSWYSSFWKGGRGNSKLCTSLSKFCSNLQYRARNLGCCRSCDKNHRPSFFQYT